MSVQVSKKKQIIFGLIIIVIILALLEVSANIWWNNFHSCTFETSEVYDHLDDRTKKELCSQFHALEYSGTWITPSDEENNLYHINSYGFRGPEFTTDKPDETYRIFLVGGSTTFGAGNLETETISYHLQERFDGIDLGLNVEVINAGIAKYWALQEIDLIKQRLLNFEPDLFIIYDGWNEVQIFSLESNAEELGANPETWKQRWSELCNLGKQQNFETIVTLQPFLGTGTKFLSDQELISYKARIVYLEQNIKNYDMYAEQLPELRQHCVNAVDLRGIYDEIIEPIYYDQAHVGNKGNEIVAQKFFDLSLPIILENSKQINKEIGVEIIQHETDVLSDKIPDKSASFFSFYKTPSLIQYILSNPERLSSQVETLSKENDFIGKNLIGENFEGRDLKNAVFNYAVINGTNFSNADLSGANFRFAKIQNTDFNGANMVGAIFTRADIKYSGFSNVDLTDSYLSGAEIRGSYFSNTIFTNSDLRGILILKSIFENNNFVNADFTHSRIYHVDFSNADLSGSKFSGSKLYFDNFENIDFSSFTIAGTGLATTHFAGSNLQKADLSNVDLTNVNFNPAFREEIGIPGTNLNYVNFAGNDLSKVILNIVTDYTKNTRDDIDNRRVKISASLVGANLSYTNLSDQNLSEINFYEANLSNANLRNVDLRYSDLTNVNLLNANLEGAILDGAILDCFNHPICN